MSNLKKKSGGPTSEEGKVRSAKNSTKHGLTSIQPSGEDEKDLVDLFSKELVDFYGPQSPLELLQIQRIAICRAKLTYLYELERVKLALASKELEHQPAKILEKIPGAVGHIKAMALEMIEYGDIKLPFNLSPELLSSFCVEIENFHGQIDNPHQFARSFPKFTKYLNTFSVAGFNNSNQWLEKLAVLAKRLETLLSFDENYYGRIEDLFHYYGLGKKYESHLKHEAMRPELEELERYQKEVVRPRYGLKPKEKEVVNKVVEPAIPSQELLANQLGLFLSLYRDFCAAEKLVERYQEVQALIRRSVSLSVSESDLLMRYQTTLERRLSSAIGELLELQKRSNAKAG